MFFFKKNAVPEWASVLNQKEYAAFISAVEQYFKRRGGSFELDDGIVRLAENDWEFGLSNLVQMCAQVKPKEYGELVKGHFSLVEESRAFHDAVDFGNFEEMKQYLGVRLYDEGYATFMGDDTTVRRPFAGEVFAVLVYDFPHAVNNVTREDVEKWGTPEEELFALGIANIRRNYPLDLEKISIGDDEVFVVETEHFFAPNILLELEEHEELVGKGGAIVAIPNRHLAIIYPICDWKVLSTLGFFATSIPQFYAQGPGSLTQEIYWYRDNQYEPLNYEPGKQVKITPSEAFLALLDKELGESNSSPGK